MERLVADMLSLARLDEGERLEMRWIAVAPFLVDLADSIAGCALADGIPEGSVEADPDLVAQVVRNLVENARRHAGPGGRVSISALAREGTLVLSVDDDGPGIPAPERERVFDRFHRSDAARDRGSGGSGLGLAIARSIVGVHGGRIWATESPLGGARISFEIPRFRAGNMRALSPNA
jgi:two-component system OmpR family sensor kinase